MDDASASEVGLARFDRDTLAVDNVERLLCISMVYDAFNAGVVCHVSTEQGLAASGGTWRCRVEPIR